MDLFAAKAARQHIQVHSVKAVLMTLCEVCSTRLLLPSITIHR